VRKRRDAEAELRRQAAGQLIASAAIDREVPPHRVAAWFSDRLHRLFDLANAD
jgi:hypothetical protein